MLEPVKNAAKLAISLQDLVDEAINGEQIEYRCSGVCRKTRNDNTQNNIFFGQAPRFFVVFLKRTAFGDGAQKNIFPVTAPATLTVPFVVGELSDCAARALFENGRALGSLKAANDAIDAARKLLPTVNSQGKDEIAMAVRNSQEALLVAQ